MVIFSELRGALKLRTRFVLLIFSLTVLLYSNCVVAHPSSVVDILQLSRPVGLSVFSPGAGVSPGGFIVGPIVSSFSPASGSVGALVTISGSNFLGATSVKFNGVAAQVFTVVSDTTITARVPSGAGTGPIRVTTPSGSGLSATNFEVGPIVSSFSPASGSVGTLVTISGVNFLGATDVQFNGVSAEIFTVVSDTIITARVPSGAGTGPIRVTTPSGDGLSTTNFIVGPLVQDFTPSSGSVGTPVTITGVNFLGATSVKFNGVAAQIFTVVSDSTITTVVPRGAGTGPIRVTTPSGSGLSSTNFKVGPLVSSFMPASGSVGALVTINGVNFLGATDVQFNGISAEIFTVVSDVRITARVPGGAGTGPIRVTTPSGSGLSPTNFEVGPLVTSFSPASGSVGELVTISGSNFLGATSVKFNGVAAQVFTVVSDTIITARVPSGAGTGPIRVITPSGSGLSSINFIVGPIITSFSPASGSVGTLVTISGVNFLGATDVQFNGVSAEIFTVVSDKTITARVPSGAGTGPIRVTTPSGTGVSPEGFAPSSSITSFTPILGSAGTIVTLVGNNFTGATAVKFHGIAAKIFTVVSDTTIMVTVPAGAVTGQITVITRSGIAISLDIFSVGPSVESFAPISGAAGLAVTITGKNFDGATAVAFNGVPVLSFTVLSAITITATVPATATTGPITVTTPIGDETSVYNFVVLPGITSFTPVSGPAGTLVTITGTGFTEATSIKFHGAPAISYSIDSDTSITVVVPGGATSGPISIKTPSGIGTTASNFTVVTGIASADVGSKLRERSWWAR